MHFSASIKFLGAALLLPTLLVGASPHSLRSAVKEVTIINPTTYVSVTVNLIQVGDSEILKVEGGWEGTPAAAEKMTKFNYDHALIEIEQKALAEPFAHGYDENNQDDYYIIEEDMSRGEYDSEAGNDPYPGRY